MKKTFYNSQQVRVPETAWTLLKYTKLNGFRQEFLSPHSNLLLTVNKSRKFISVMNGPKVLEEVCLITIPPPLCKSRDRDIFIHVMAQDGKTLTKFRVKFVSSNDHNVFIEFISQFVKVTVCNNDYSTSSNPQDGFSQPPQRLDLYYSTCDGRRRMNDMLLNQPNKIQTEVLNDILQPSFTYGMSTYTNQSTDQVVPALSETFSSTQTTADETILTGSQNSLMFSQVVQDHCTQFVDQSVQTDPLLSLEDLLTNEALLKEKLLLRLKDPSFTILLNKSAEVLQNFHDTIKGQKHSSEVVSYNLISAAVSDNSITCLDQSSSQSA